MPYTNSKKFRFSGRVLLNLTMVFALCCMLQVASVSVQASSDSGDGLKLVKNAHLGTESKTENAEASDAVKDWTLTAQEIGDALSAARENYDRDQITDAINMISAIYFDEFEKSGLEEAIEHGISNKRKEEIEKKFADIQQAMLDKEDSESITQITLSLAAMLNNDSTILSKEHLLLIDMAHDGEQASAPEGAEKAASETKTPDWNEVVKQVQSELFAAYKTYQAEGKKNSVRKVGEIYLNNFEKNGLEEAIEDQISNERKEEVEKQFSAIQRAMLGSKPEADVRKEIETLGTMLEQDAGKLK